MLPLKVSQEHFVKLEMSANMATATGIALHVRWAISKDFALLADAFPPISSSIIQDTFVKLINP